MRNLRLAGGTDTQQAATVYDQSTGGLVPTGIVDPHGNHYFRSQPNFNPASTGGSSTGGSDVELATLRQRLNGAFLWLTVLTAASGIAFLFLISRLDDRFDKVGEKLDKVVEQIGEVRVSVAQVKNDTAQASPGAGQTGPVHSGAGTRSGKP